MEKTKQAATPYDFEGRIPLGQAIPLGLQHVLAMFVGNLTPILIITSACAVGEHAQDFAAIQVSLLQNAMLVAGIVTLVQLYAVGPIGGKVPIIMGTSSGFIGVCRSVATSMGGGILGYAAIMGASIVGGILEAVLGVFLKPLRRFFPAMVTGTAREVTDPDEKRRALRALCEKLTPANMAGDNFDRAVAKSLPRTGVWRIRMEEVTGKEKPRP